MGMGTAARLKLSIFQTFCLGFFIGLLLTTYYDMSGSTAGMRTLEEQNNKLIFVTYTSYSILEIPVLVKFAQALYPIRDSVIWIVVSGTEVIDFKLPPPKEKVVKGKESKMVENKDRKIIRIKNISPEENINIFGEEQLKLAMSRISDKIKTFGIPFVLLKTDKKYMVHGGEEKYPNFVKNKRSAAYATGLFWALRNIKKGMLIFAHEQYSFNHNLFQQMNLSANVLVWPTGLGTPLGFTAPIVKKDNAYHSSVPIGYHNGKTVRWNEIIFEHGAFAINLEYIIRKLSFSQTLRLVTDGQCTSIELGIPLDDIQAMSTSKIQTWRTLTWGIYLPKNLQIKKHYPGTNIFKLWKNLFNEYYGQFEVIQNATDKLYLRQY